MSKRGAANYLTDQNWEEEDEGEEAGMFKEANKEVIEKREIKKAKRRGLTTGDSAASGTGGLFKAFTGFTSAKPAASAPAFSFGQPNDSKKEPEAAGFKFGSTTATENTSSAKTNSESKSATAFGGFSSTSTPATSNATSKPTVNGTGSKSDKSKYLAQLKSLNEGVAKWTKEHVDKNPYCILTPIFQDYKTHLEEIEKKYPQKEDDQQKAEEKEEKGEEKKPVETEDVKDEKQSPAKTSTSVTPTSAAPTFSFGSSSKSVFGGGASTTSFGGGSSTSSFGGGAGTTSPPTFSFGTSANPPKTHTAGPNSLAFASASSSMAGGNQAGIFGGTSTSQSGYSTMGTSGFSFGAAAAKAIQSAGDGANKTGDEEYEPPKPEVTEVKEDDAFYTKRCKLYFKKDDQWVEKGVGNIHLKPCGEKTQLLIRADTSLGNILLNIMLSSSVPMTRQGKNNVAIMCIPNPPMDEKKPDCKTPVSMLIRVKTGEDADQLLKHMKEGK